MSDKFLPKSLHTVRILVAVAEYATDRADTFKSPLDAVLFAAGVIGYAGASRTDPLIAKAVAQFAGK